MDIVKKSDFVEIKYTGYVNGEVFDSNIEEDLKKLNPKAKPKKTIVIVGQKMLVPGFDDALEGKEIGKDYEINVEVKDGFGERKRELVKTIPLKIFTDKKIDPRPGMVFDMDNMLAKVIAVSGARVVTDFNNPLAGKILTYKFKIVRRIVEEKEKVESVLELLFKFVPDFEIKDKIIVKGPKAFGPYIDMIKDKFKELIGKELGFEEKEEKISSEEKKEGLDDIKKEIKRENTSEESKKDEENERVST